MSNEDYLRKLLESQEVKPGSPEMKEMDGARAQVEEIIRDNFGGSNPAIRYGGSRAKGTMNLDGYDLDIICYFPHEEHAVGETIAEIYDNVQLALQEDFVVEPKTCALRVKGKNKNDLHVDVVPGRFVDDTKTTAFLRFGPDSRLKTDPHKHIDHVRNSGRRDIIRLAKLWNNVNDVGLKTFPLELLVIESLKGDSDSGLVDLFEHVLHKFAYEIGQLHIEDPANPTGNDLSEIFNDTMRQRVSRIAAANLKVGESAGWENIFGPLEMASTDVSYVDILKSAAAASSHRSGPWCKIS